MKKYSPLAIQALKEALTHIYWRKKDIRSFIYHTIDNKAIISTIDWGSNVKHESISQLIDRMINRQDIYRNDLLNLFDSTMHFNDFSHLEYWDDSEIKIKRAKDAIKALRQHAQGYFQLKEEKDRAEKRKNIYKNIINERLTFSEKISELKNDFSKLTMEASFQKRGFLFEKFLNKLFLLFDLDPKSSFKIIGEQIGLWCRN